MAGSITTTTAKQTAAACKERYRADGAHKVFVEMSKAFLPKRSAGFVLLHYGRILQEEWVGQDEAKEIHAQIDKLKQRIRNAQALMLNAELTVTEYKDIRNALAPEIDLLERRKVALLTSEDYYQQYLDKGIPMLQNIAKHWLAADLSGKQHIVGSIFLQKLVFEKTTYQTIGENPVLALIVATGAGSDTFKNKKGQQFADLST